MTVPSTAEVRRLQESLRSRGLEVVPRDLLEAVVDDRPCSFGSPDGSSDFDLALARRIPLTICRTHQLPALHGERCPVNELRRLLTQGSSS